MSEPASAYSEWNLPRITHYLLRLREASDMQRPGEPIGGM